MDSGTLSQAFHSSAVQEPGALLLAATVRLLDLSLDERFHHGELLVLGPCTQGLDRKATAFNRRLVVIRHTLNA